MNHSEAERLVATNVTQSPEDSARADMYALSAYLLLTAPDADFLAELATADSLPVEQTNCPLDLAWEQLVLAAHLMTPEQIKQEFNALFVSTGTPRINPNASLYLTGSMMDQPLAVLRADLARRGLARLPGVAELEDHLGALCETMRILITGEQGGEQQPLQVQMAFFEKHLAPWYRRCLDDIRSADDTGFYRRVADFIVAFLDVEAEAFQIEDACLPDQAATEGDQR